MFQYIFAVNDAVGFKQC